MARRDGRREKVAYAAAPFQSLHYACSWAPIPAVSVMKVQRESERPIVLSPSLRTQIGLLVIATSLIQLANGFFGTFVSLRVATAGFAAPGLVLSAYFVGFTLGTLRCNRIIQRVGHIRAYA